MSDDNRVAIHESRHALLAVALNVPLARVRLGDHPSYDLADGPLPPP